MENARLGRPEKRVKNLRGETAPQGPRLGRRTAAEAPKYNKPRGFVFAVNFLDPYIHIRTGWFQRLAPEPAFSFTLNRRGMFAAESVLALLKLPGSRQVNGFFRTFEWQKVMLYE